MCVCVCVWRGDSLRQTKLLRVQPPVLTAAHPKSERLWARSSHTRPHVHEQRDLVCTQRSSSSGISSVRGSFLTEWAPQPAHVVCALQGAGLAPPVVAPHSWPCPPTPCSNPTHAPLSQQPQPQPQPQPHTQPHTHAHSHTTNHHHTAAHHESKVIQQLRLVAILHTVLILHQQ